MFSSIERKNLIGRLESVEEIVNGNISYYRAIVVYGGFRSHSGNGTSRTIRSRIPLSRDDYIFLSDLLKDRKSPSIRFEPKLA